MGRNMSAARTDGFIRNIHSRNPFDVIRADVVISRLEKQAHYWIAWRIILLLSEKTLMS
ncbi:hypothetical protein H0O69_21160 [Escherichia coli]|nr:hypothetical protein [Escherichia coli]